MPATKLFPKCKVVPFRLPQKEYDALKQFADNHGLRVSDVCQTAVTGYIENIKRHNKGLQVPDSRRVA